VFFVVTFLVSWGAWFAVIGFGGRAMVFPMVVLCMLGGFGPLIGALVVRLRLRRRPAPVHAVRFRGRRLAWMLPALVVAGGVVVQGALLSSVVGGPAINLAPGLQIVALSGGPAAFVISQLLGGPLSEEPGWRGTAYPRLRDRVSRPQALLILGTVWTTWHLPLFFIHGTVQHGFGLLSWAGLFFLLSIGPLTVLTGFAYERAGVAASASVHFGFNATFTLLTATAPLTMGLIAAVLAVVATILLALPQPLPMHARPA